MSKNTKPVDPEAKIKRLQKSLDYYKGQTEDYRRLVGKQQRIIDKEQKWRLDFQKLIKAANTDYLEQYE